MWSISRPVLHMMRESIIGQNAKCFKMLEAVWENVDCIYLLLGPCFKCWQTITKFKYNVILVSAISLLLIIPRTYHLLAAPSSGVINEPPTSILWKWKKNSSLITCTLNIKLSAFWLLHAILLSWFPEGGKFKSRFQKPRRPKRGNSVAGKIDDESDNSDDGTDSPDLCVIGKT